jgi:cbb3-type cytochrome oxidase subunit 3
MSASGTAGFAQVGFFISLLLFVLIVFWALLRPKASMQAAARSVLLDGTSDEQNIPEKELGHG